ncbi:DUF341 domain protein [Penicillium capsulatum]|uniref:DUF341 domain protein n=1 Tax=Penicillium capsulatum TaxID=69766 RepID=A0A9W9IP75_9EURO|nr:DUF341 domain protein [Penicillium capsulatum]KAJ6121668.1 DUF341 domain protein [Penicillium capsulatum]
MRFLCLHGIGTNSHVFETQFATISYEMDRHHSFDFVEGTEIEPIAPDVRFVPALTPCPHPLEIKPYYSSRDTYYSYARPTAESHARALAQLQRYVDEEGPFDGAIGFSQGAALVSTYLIQHRQTRPGESLPFRCAIFFSASRPFDVAGLAVGILRWAAPLGSGAEPVLNLPTAHIWGTKDVQYRDESEFLRSMCNPVGRETYIHGGGHEVPGPRAKEDVQGCIRVIRRVIEKASVDL